MKGLRLFFCGMICIASMWSSIHRLSIIIAVGRHLGSVATKGTVGRACLADAFSPRLHFSHIMSNQL